AQHAAQCDQRRPAQDGARRRGRVHLRHSSQCPRTHRSVRVAMTLRRLVKRLTAPPRTSAQRQEDDARVLTRRIFGWLRLLAAAVCVVSLTHRMLWGMGSQTLASQNFFAYLTIQSNLAFAALTIVAGITALRHAEDPAWLTSARALVLSWTITAGLAFSIIVWQAGLRGIPITVPWSDVVLHYVLPAFGVLSWLRS